MGVYIYCIKDDYKYQSSIKGRKFENEWFKLDEDGTLTVKGSNYKGYAWDGCSPKLKIGDICPLGTPDAVLNFTTGQSKTYYASLVHDVFYQFSSQLKSFIKRREVDEEFYSILKRDNFRLAKFYFLGVHWFGWLFWGKKR